MWSCIRPCCQEKELGAFPLGSWNFPLCFTFVSFFVFLKPRRSNSDNLNPTRIQKTFPLSPAFGLDFFFERKRSLFDISNLYDWQFFRFNKILLREIGDRKTRKATMNGLFGSYLMPSRVTINHHVESYLMSWKVTSNGLYESYIISWRATMIGLFNLILYLGGRQ